MIIWTHAGGPSPVTDQTLCRWLSYRDDPTFAVIASSAEQATDNMTRLFPAEEPPYTVTGAQRLQLVRVS